MNRITKLIITFAVIICVAFVGVFAVQNKDKIKDLFVSDADRFLQLQKDLMDYQDIVKTLEKDVADMETTLDDLENINTERTEELENLNNTYTSIKDEVSHVLLPSTFQIVDSYPEQVNIQLIFVTFEVFQLLKFKLNSFAL